MNLGATERIALVGRVDDPAFLPWIERHRARLGLDGGVAASQAGRVELVVRGAPDLIDALELACSLGPAEVLVERTERWAEADASSPQARAAHD